MSGARRANTLFEAVPALGAVSAQGSGRAKLIAVGSDHPGFELAEGVSRFGRDPGQCHHVILSSHVSRCSLRGARRGRHRPGQGPGQPQRHLRQRRAGHRARAPARRPLGLSRRVTMVLVRDEELQKPSA